MNRSGVQLLEHRRELLKQREQRKMATIGGAGGRSGIVAPLASVVGPSIPMPEPYVSGEGAAAYGSAQLLALSVEGASISPGGAAVPFDSVLAAGGSFAAPGSGGSWVHPVGGTYSAVVKLAWESFTGGGTIRLLVNGVSIPHGLIVEGTAGSEALGVVQYEAAAGSLGQIQVTHGGASAQTCDAAVSVAITDPDALPVEDPSEAAETFWFDSRNPNPVSTMVLEAGSVYTIRITGNFHHATETPIIAGATDDLMWASAGYSETTGATGDWDVLYASHSGAFPVGHSTRTVFDLGSGPAHVEPRGGPYSTPQPNHSYLFDVTGEGSTLTVGPAEGGARSDNNGQFKIEIFEGTI